jgi:hypothetical protein
LDQSVVHALSSLQVGRSLGAGREVHGASCMLHECSARAVLVAPPQCALAVLCRARLAPSRRRWLHTAGCRESRLLVLSVPVRTSWYSAMGQDCACHCMGLQLCIALRCLCFASLCSGSTV